MEAQPFLNVLYGKQAVKNLQVTQSEASVSKQPSQSLE